MLWASAARAWSRGAIVVVEERWSWGGVGIERSGRGDRHGRDAEEVVVAGTLGVASGRMC
jgi:hypothetical protein